MSNVSATDISTEASGGLPREEKLDCQQPIPQEKPREVQVKEYQPRRLSEAEDVCWRIPGVLVDKGITCLVGESEAGKTTLALQLSKSLLDGQPFLGLPVQPVDTVLWLPLDEGASMLKDQAKKIDPLLPKKLLYWDSLSWSAADAVLTPLAELVFSCSPRVVILDALNSIGLTSENDNAEIAKVYQQLRRVAVRGGLSVLLLHHLRKLQVNDRSELKQRVRGAGDIVGKADCVLGLERADHAATLTTVKVRAKERLEMSLRQDPDTLLYRVVKGRAEFIRDLLLQGKSRGEIVDGVREVYGGKKSTVERAVDRVRRSLGNKPQFDLGEASGGQN